MNIKQNITERLSEGLIIKNYIGICKILEVKPTKGKGRDYHFRELERYCTYKKVERSHKLIITEVYDEPLSKIDGRINNGGNNTIYEDLMDKLLINLLIDHGCIDESYSALMNDYFDFFTDENDKLNRMGYKRYAEVNDMSKGLVMIYQQKMNGVVKGCLETSLSRLARNNVITYKKNITILDNKFMQSFAGETMIAKIEKFEEKVYKELEMTPFMRSNPHKNRQFKSKVCEYLEIVSYWNIYSFSLIDKDIENVKEDRDELIIRFINSTVRNVRNKDSKDDFGKKFKPYNSYKFTESIDKLTNNLWNADYLTETEFIKLISCTEENENEDEVFILDEYIPF